VVINSEIMKKTNVLFFALTLTMFCIVSCGPKKAEDIDPSKIKTVCEWVDAMVLISESLIPYAEQYEKLEVEYLEAPSGSMKESRLERELDELENKLEPYIELYEEMIQRMLKLEFDIEELMKCKGYAKMEKLMTDLDLDLDLDFDLF
jgi:hypothetical protein